MYANAKTGERPNVFIQNQSNGKTLLLRGDKIFYMITFPKDNLSDIILAFDNYKKFSNFATK